MTRNGEWPAGLSSRPLLVWEQRALDVRDAWIAADAALAAGTPAGGRIADAPRYRIERGIAVVPVNGALISRGDFMGEQYAFTSYRAITQEVRRAAADPAIAGIVLAVSSPGGTVDGILSAASAIREARSVKLVTALVGGMAASAGYWLAAQAGEIVLADDLAQVGSIGVYTLHIDASQMLEQLGLDVTVISSGRHKVDGHPFAPLPDSVRADIQQEVDDLRLLFAREFAAGRPALSADLALATEARMYRALNPRSGARPAIEAKLADRVGSLDRVIADLSAGGRSRRATPTTKGHSMDSIQGSPTAIAGTAQADHDTAVANARAAGLAEGRTIGMQAERDRIVAILALDESRDRREAALAIALTGASVEQAKAVLAVTPAATPAAGSAGSAAMRAESQPLGLITEQPRSPAAAWDKALARVGATLPGNA